MEDKIDSINKKVNFIVIVIVAQIVLTVGTYLYYTITANIEADKIERAAQQEAEFQREYQRQMDKIDFVE